MSSLAVKEVFLTPGWERMSWLLKTELFISEFIQDGRWKEAEHASWCTVSIDFNFWSMRQPMWRFKLKAFLKISPHSTGEKLLWNLNFCRPETAWGEADARLSLGGCEALWRPQGGGRLIDVGHLSSGNRPLSAIFRSTYENSPFRHLVLHFHPAWCQNNCCDNNYCITQKACWAAWYSVHIHVLEIPNQIHLSDNQ